MAGVDYFHTYTPLERITSIKILMALASNHKLCVHQMDIKIALLHDDLNEKVDMKNSKEFILPGIGKKVCRLV